MSKRFSRAGQSTAVMSISVVKRQLASVFR